jgi:hypothetical protein
MRPTFGALDLAWSKPARTLSVRLSATPRPDAMAALVRRTRTPCVQHVRDDTYYRWRFRNPLARYRFVYRDAPDLQGFLVLQLPRLGDGADIAVVDWAVSEPGMLATLLAQVAETGGYDSLSIWTASLPPDVVATLDQNGFAAVDDSRGNAEFQPGLLAIGSGGSDVRADAAAIAARLASPDGWDLRMAYSDYY